jgi:hypothetical protein
MGGELRPSQPDHHIPKPLGGLNSGILDTLQERGPSDHVQLWLRVQLGRGLVEGQQEAAVKRGISALDESSNS